MKNLLVCALLCSVPGACAISLVVEGKSEYQICVAADASPSERRGAAELQRFLFEMSGARLPLAEEDRCPGTRAILIGRGRLTEGLKIPFERLGDEGFALQTHGTKLVIAGGRRRGTMYGVYTLLEKLGCRWFTRDVSRIPRRETIVIEQMDQLVTPAFEYREPFFREALDRDWAARNRMNGSSMKLNAATGGKVTYYPFVHSFYKMIPPAKYFREHPEYFSLIDGRRRDTLGQLCLTNPEVLRVAVAAVFEWIEERPDAGILSVSQNDWMGWCECDGCRRVEREEGGVHAGPLVRFVNAIAAEVEKKHPEKLIDTLAYMYTEEPPARTRPRHNVRIRLCPIGVCQAHPYEQCPRSRYFMKTLRAWSRLTDRLYIWHYNTNFAHYLLPFPDFEELAADIPMYRCMGVKGLFMQGDYSTGGGGENAGLRSWVMAKLLWHPEASVSRLVDEYLEGVYGRAARPMRAYHDWLHEQVRPPDRHLYIYMQPGAPYLSPRFLDRAERLFAEAEAAADDAATLRRIRKDRLSIEYTRLMQAARFGFEGGRYAPPAIAVLRERFAGLFRTARAYGMTNLSEGRTLDQQEAGFRERLRPYRSVRIGNRHWALDIVPELNGRMVRMMARSGINALYEPDPGDPAYPDAGGQAVFVRADYHAPAPLAAAWRVEAVSAESVTLVGTTAEGLGIERRIAFTPDGSAVRTQTILRNHSAAAREAVLESRWEIGSGPLDGATVDCRNAAGGRTVTRLMQAGEQPMGRADYRASGIPHGEWLLTTPTALWTARFPHALLSRAGMEWIDRDITGVRLTLWSQKRLLQPGESLHLDVDYAMRARGRGQASAIRSDASR